MCHQLRPRDNRGCRGGKWQNAESVHWAFGTRWTCRCHAWLCMVSAGGLDLVPLCLHQMNFVFANDSVVAREDMTWWTCLERPGRVDAVDRSSDTYCDDSGCASEPVTPIAAVGTLRITNYLGSLGRCQNFSSELDGMEAMIVKSVLVKRVQGTLGNFFQR